MLRFVAVAASAAVGFAALPGSAASITYSNSYAGATEVGVTHEFFPDAPLFDPSLGSLTSVTISGAGDLTLRLSGFNPSTTENGSYSLNGGAQIYAETVLPSYGASIGTLAGESPGFFGIGAFNIAPGQSFFIENEYHLAFGETLIEGVDIAAADFSGVGPLVNFFSLTSGGNDDFTTLIKELDLFYALEFVVTYTYDAAAVPEPAGLALVGLGLSALAWRRRRAMPANG